MTYGSRALLLILWPTISEWLATYFSNSAREDFFPSPS
jgi:hypothetical protein